MTNPGVQILLLAVTALVVRWILFALKVDKLAITRTGALVLSVILAVLHTQMTTPFSHMLINIVIFTIGTVTMFEIYMIKRQTYVLIVVVIVTILLLVTIFSPLFPPAIMLQLYT